MLFDMEKARLDAEMEARYAALPPREALILRQLVQQATTAITNLSRESKLDADSAGRHTDELP